MAVGNHHHHAPVLQADQGRTSHQETIPVNQVADPMVLHLHPDHCALSVQQQTCRLVAIAIVQNRRQCPAHARHPAITAPQEITTAKNLTHPHCPRCHPILLLSSIELEEVEIHHLAPVWKTITNPQSVGGDQNHGPPDKSHDRLMKVYISMLLFWCGC